MAFRWALLLLLIVGSAICAVHKMKIGYTEPLKVRMYKQGKLKEYLAQKEAQRQALMSVSQNVVDYDDMAYFAMVTLGTPGQSFKAYLDSGSATLWMPDSSCLNGTSEECGDYCFKVPAETCKLFCLPKCCETTTVRASNGGCNTKSLFDSSKSSSYVKNGETFSITYTTGTVSGFLGQDTLCMQGTTLCIKNQIFGQVTQIGGGFVTQPIDGILGLAFRPLAYDYITPPVINAIEQGLLDQPLFTVYMAHSGPTVKEQGGMITYGGLDTVNCDSQVNYVKLTTATYFQFTLAGVAAGTYKATKASGWNAVSKTSATYIGGPPAIVAKIAAEVGATYNEAYSSYFIDCNANSPDISFTIDGINYNITSSNYIMSVGAGPCMFAFFELNSSGFMPAWMLGPPLIREYCQVYDIGGERLGFAKALPH